MIDVAGAGFRLSLLLNAVGEGLSTADMEIKAIAKEISLFSLMLNQAGRAIEAAESIVSQNAMDVAKDMTSHSQTVFTQIKAMVHMSQQKDEQGNIRSITVAHQVNWCWKQKRVPYLLGQLDAVKLSLAIMLQVLQLARSIASSQ